MNCQISETDHSTPKASIISVRGDRQGDRFPGQARGRLRQGLSLDVQEDPFQSALQFLSVLAVFHVKPKRDVFGSNERSLTYRRVLNIRNQVGDKIPMPLANPGAQERA